MKKVWAVYFSATKTTEKVVCTIAEALAEALSTDWGKRDFTLPEARKEEYSFGCGDIVIMGTPVYAGRVPNVLLPFLKTIKGEGTKAVPVVLYGNRNFDDALAELRDILETQGFICGAAAAFVGEHAFSRILAAGRPDEEDLLEARKFGRSVGEKIINGRFSGGISVPGRSPSPGYFKPRGPAGEPVDIRKVKSLVTEDCDDCGLCARVCPMGSICPDNVREYRGICIKCGACIKGCPRDARYYDDPGFLFHKRDLEERLTERAEIGIWL
ncbi:MAG: EFR1 family ferrodoxin [Ruminococcus sp.]|jgi:ferredoxin/flavodoxin